MNLNPAQVIATTVKRYLSPPDDNLFGKDFEKARNLVPSSLIDLIEKYLPLHRITESPLIKGDTLLVDYLIELNGSDQFPANDKFLKYKKEYFTPDDNDFYNRVIYQVELERMREENNILKSQLQEAIDAKKAILNRDFRFIKHLAQGGFGSVWLVKHTVSGQLFAIKQLKNVDKQDQSMIQKEIELLASFNNPNIIAFKAGFNVEDVLYLVMEFCPKGSLADKIKNQGKLNEQEIINYFLTLTKTLNFLHDKGVIHHDIKPSNILVAEDDQLKIGDFGCTNTTIGTTCYLPPEHFKSSGTEYTPGIATDIYSLGVTLMECAIGYNPFAGKSASEILTRLKMADLPISFLPHWLQSTILQATHPDPSQRFTSMQDFHDHLLQRNIPRFLNESIIEIEKQAAHLQKLVNRKQWIKANRFIKQLPNTDNNLNLLIAQGNYYLQTHNIRNAQKCFEQAAQLNPNANIEKQLAEIYLQTYELTKASAILTSHINRNFTDLEAHNQLLHTYFLSEKWELGYEQAKYLTALFPSEEIFKANLHLFRLLTDKSFAYNHETKDSPFFGYNKSVFCENTPESWKELGQPSLNTKLLFHEFKFREIQKSNNTIEVKINGRWIPSSDRIISFGREGYNYNTFSNFNCTSVSRRHFVIVNMKDNVWLYDLNSASGVFVDGHKITNKCFLLGLHQVKYGNFTIEIKTSKEILL